MSYFFMVLQILPRLFFFTYNWIKFLQPTIINPYDKMASITRGLVWANDQSVIWKFILYYEQFICIYEVIISYLLIICHELSVSISAEKAPYTASLAMTTCRHPGRNRLSFQSYLSKLQVMILKTWFVESEASRHSAQQLFKRSIIHL